MLRTVALALVLLCTISASAQRPAPTSGTFPFHDIHVHYEMFSQDRAAPLVLFLHGAKFDSSTWVKIGTMGLLHEQGYKALAIDLPGFGKTPKLPYVDDNARAELVAAAASFGQQGAEAPLVLVSPSMSGKWAMAFIDRHGTKLAGWVALAPAGVAAWPGPSSDVHRQVKLLAMYGVNDRMREDSSTLTKLFSNSLSVTIPDAGHPCYVDKPHDFHRDFLAFLRKVASVPSATA